MTTFPVRVRWGKNRYDLEVDTTEIPVVFKAQLMTITDVPMERQKIISRGQILADESWEEFPIKKDSLLTLVGTSDPVPQVCVDSRVPGLSMSTNSGGMPGSGMNMDSFELTNVAGDMDDMNDIPLGFYNYGNTCFVNAVVQFIKRITPLRRYFLSLETPAEPIKNIANQQERLMQTLRQSIVYSEIDLNAEQLDYTMREFLQLVDKQFPEFAQVNEFGIRKQHDSSEFFGKMLGIFKQHMQSHSTTKTTLDNTLDTFMRVEYQQEIGLRDAINSKNEVSTISDYMVQCVVDSSVREITAGIKLGLEDVIEKYNEDLNKNCDYTKILRFSRLPEFLVINLGRFHYKSKQNITAKIVKEVKFPMTLDLYNFCSEDYKKQLISMREALASHKQIKSLNFETETDGSAKMDPVISLESQNLATGTSGSAFYNLKAIITHRGRTSTEGHYVCWMKLKNHYWVKMDDNEVVIVTVDDIMKLCGGGDWHMAYNLLYECEKFPPE